MRTVAYSLICVLVTELLLLGGQRYFLDTILSSFFESLQLHISFLAAVGSVIAFIVKRHWYSMATFVVSALIAWHGVLMHAEFGVDHPVEVAGDSFRLMSFNIENLNLRNGARIASAVVESDADVVALFEAEPIKKHLEEISKVYPHHIGCGVYTALCDTVVFSKRPIAFFEFQSLSTLWRQRWVRSDIVINGTLTTFVFVHLTKPYFDSYQKEELFNLRKSLRDIKHPLIVAGDFNAATITPDIQLLMRTSRLETVFPEPATWPIAAGPFGISIDHVYSRGLMMRSVERIQDNFGSNHFGLMSEFSLFTEPTNKSR